MFRRQHPAWQTIRLLIHYPRPFEFPLYSAYDGNPASLKGNEVIDTEHANVIFSMEESHASPFVSAMTAGPVEHPLTLQSLPQELRDEIYGYVVIEDEPILAYTAAHVRRRRADDAPGGMVVHKLKAFPELPEAAFACCQAY